MKGFISTFLCLLLSGSWLFAQKRILHYTETTGWDHHTRAHSLAMFNDWANDLDYVVVNDNNGSEFNSLTDLSEYAIVVFSNTSGSSGLNASQRANFEAYINGGGSYLGIHAASDTYRHSSANGNAAGTWDWYAETVAGASVQESPNHTSANHQNTMTHHSPGHEILDNLPAPWNKTEEYYYWENGYLNPDFTELLRVGKTGNNSHDAPRMMAHCKTLSAGGRAFYTALGHAPSNFSSDQNFRALIRNAVEWLLEEPPSSTFPVELVTFEVAPSAGAATLRWTTATEENSAFFAAERSVDGVFFDQLGSVTAAGQSRHSRQYAFRDERIVPEQPYFYRLRMVDLDGTFAYSPVVQYRATDWTHQIEAVFPNPTQGAFQVRLQVVPHQAYTLRLIDAWGRECLRQALAPSASAHTTIKVDGRTLSAGLYHLVLESPHGLLSTGLRVQ